MTTAAKVRATIEFLKRAAVTLDIEKGDVLLGGRFKNVPMTVEDIATDDLGQPTVNGKKLLSFRIKKTMPAKTPQAEEPEQKTAANLLGALALLKHAATVTINGYTDTVNTKPTERQIAAENYEKAHVRLHGMAISIENPKGSTRSGKDPDGKAWSCKIPEHYGYICGTEGDDGDPLDCYIGPNESSTKAFVVDQFNPDGDFDEHKTFLGFDDEEAVRKCYDSGFSDGSGPSRRGVITAVTLPTFKAWAFSKRVKGPFATLPEEKEASQALRSRSIDDHAFSWARMGYELKEAAEKPKREPRTFLLAKPGSDVRASVLKMHEALAPEDIVELEHDPHITVKAMLKSKDWGELRGLLEGMKPGSVILGSPTIFDSPEYDVLKLPVLYGGGLPAMHQFLSDNAEHDETWPEYRPHLTIAYLKKGTGKKYTELPLDETLQGMIPIRHIVYSREGRQIPILKGE